MDMMITEEMLEECSYLGKDKAFEVVVTNPNRIFDMCERITPVRPDKAPPVIPDSDKTLRDICETRAHQIYGPDLPVQVSSRLEHELDSIIKNGFAVMYIIAQKLVWKSNEDGYLVGSRGSVGSSFVATMSGITEVNPLPPHYYCPECHYSEFDSEICKEYVSKSGYDLPEKDCPVCGHRLVSSLISTLTSRVNTRVRLMTTPKLSLAQVRPTEPVPWVLWQKKQLTAWFQNTAKSMVWY